MTAIAPLSLLIMMSSILMPKPAAETMRPYQPLHIPEAISGKSFQLNLHKASKSFWKGATTKTYGYNKESFWGPTLIFNQGDDVSINVKNDLDEPTTTHWHGLHIPAVMDGGPHQVIAPGDSWSPTFTVRNTAGTYWYHPHVHETTQNQLTSGAGGLIIIRDPIESKLKLPRIYGVDDIPLVLTSRRFLTNNEFSFGGDTDKYGDYPIANGVMDAETTLPAQYVRLRILNAEIERGYRLGFSDHRKFYVIATDGGLVEKPIELTEMKLMVGERVELLVDLSQDKVGSSLDLMAFNSNQPFGFPGGEPGSTPPNGGYLNNIDFKVLHINVGGSTSTKVTELPTSLTTNHFWTEDQVTNSRFVRIEGGRPNFYFDQKSYDIHANNQIVKLGAVEKWTVTNNNIFGHSFHIHDVQFKIVSRSSGPVEAYEQGWKDTMYVPRGESVSFITKFDDFESDTHAFMYHCHMSNHEDDGLMGQFLVTKNPETAEITFRQKTDHPITAAMTQASDSASGVKAHEFSELDDKGYSVDLDELTKEKPVVLFFIEAGCPCSKEATPFFNQLQTAFGDACKVVGVINSDQATARQWVNQVGAKFSVVSDLGGKVIKSYGAQSSVYTTLVAKGGTISRTYPGYGREMLTEIGAKIVKMTSAKPQGLDFSAAPAKLTAGCPYPSFSNQSW